MGNLENPKSSNSTASHVGELNRLLMLDAADLRALLTPDVCLDALEKAYRQLYAVPSDKGRSLAFETRDGKFHVKAGLYPGTHGYFSAKINANFPQNPQRASLPTIQGLIVLCDGADGRPLAILQSGELTGRRTAAATALAAKYGARPDARSLTLIGCGAQSRFQAEAIIGVLPIGHITIFDSKQTNAESFAGWAPETLSVEAVRTDTIADAVAAGDVIVTTTPSTAPIITADMVAPGSFIAAVGADNPDKQELDPQLFKDARILVDDLDQCATDGDLAHAIQAGIVTIANVTATLADLAADAKQGRVRDDEIVVFDSTGTGLQDVAAAVAAYEAARKQGPAD